MKMRPTSRSICKWMWKIPIPIVKTSEFMLPAFSYVKQDHVVGLTHHSQLSSSSCSDVANWRGSGEEEEKIEKSLSGFVRERGHQVLWKAEMQWRGEIKQLVLYCIIWGLFPGVRVWVRALAIMYFNRIFKHRRVAQVARQTFPNQEASVHLVTVRKKGITVNLMMHKET